MSCFKDLFAGVAEKEGAAPADIADKGYTNFEEAPQSILDDGDNSDEDVGREMKNVPMKEMDYDSPDADEENRDNVAAAQDGE